MDELVRTIDSLVGPDIHPLANLANVAAALYTSLERVNWAGFYLLDRGALWLGPFQGKVACTRIEIGKGVCGTALARDAVIVVPDVHAFPGHIACDAASCSEIVLPLRFGGRPVGVLDIDSPVPDRFSEADRDALTAIAAIISERCDFSQLSYDLRSTL